VFVALDFQHANASVVKVLSVVKILVTGCPTLFEYTWYIDHKKFVAYGFFVYHIVSYSFGSIFYHCIYSCTRMFCMLLFNFVNYVFL
jgi:hypothetical protein